MSPVRPKPGWDPEPGEVGGEPSLRAGHPKIGHRPPAPAPAPIAAPCTAATIGLPVSTSRCASLSADAGRASRRAPRHPGRGCEIGAGAEMLPFRAPERSRAPRAYRVTYTSSASAISATMSVSMKLFGPAPHLDRGDDARLRDAAICSVARSVCFADVSRPVRRSFNVAPRVRGYRGVRPAGQ